MKNWWRKPPPPQSLLLEQHSLWSWQWRMLQLVLLCHHRAQPVIPIHHQRILKAPPWPLLWSLLVTIKGPISEITWERDSTKSSYQSFCLGIGWDSNWWECEECKVVRKIIEPSNHPLWPKKNQSHQDWNFRHEGAMIEQCRICACIVVAKGFWILNSSLKSRRNPTLLRCTIFAMNVPCDKKL